MKTGIRIENGLFIDGRRRVPLISGEFHYWRVARENWDAVFDAIRAMGLSVVSSYVPWNYHELAPGKYDFTGKTSPQRDLDGFLKLAQRAGLYAIVRPGPHIGAEWPNGGPPDRATAHDVLSQEFMRMARDYVRNVCKAIAPHQITRGGNVILVQADNEPSLPAEKFSHRMGCAKAAGVFTEWLAGKYENNLERLNECWQSDLQSFDDACFHFHEAYVNTALPMAERLLPERRFHKRYADSFEFVGWYTASVIDNVVGWLRDGGIDVPVFANSWSPLYADFTKFEKAADLSGCDIYPQLYIEGDRPTEDNWRYNIDIVKLVEADVKNGNVWSAEFQAGQYPLWMSGFKPPEHFVYVPLTLMSRGLKGWNWYMLVNRDNWEHAPINEWGRTNEFFPAHKKVVEIAKRIEPWNLKTMFDLDLFMCRAHRVIDPGNFKTVFEALEEADIDFAYFDPTSENAPRTKVMIYCGTDWLEKEAAARLERFVKDGGTLIAFSRCPVFDETGAPLHGPTFDDPDGARPVTLPVTISYKNSATVIRNVGHLGWKVNFGYFGKVPGVPIRLAFGDTGKAARHTDDASSFEIGYAKKVGRGKIIHVGSNPSGKIVTMLLEAEGLLPHAGADDRNVRTSLHRKNDGSSVLFVTNRSPELKCVRVRLNTDRLKLKLNGKYVLDDLVNDRSVVMEGAKIENLSLDVPGHSVGVYRIRRAGRTRARRDT